MKYRGYIILSYGMLHFLVEWPWSHSRKKTDPILCFDTLEVAPGIHECCHLRGVFGPGYPWLASLTETRCSSCSCSVRPRAQAREGQDHGRDAVVADEDPGVEGHVRDDGRRQDHRDDRSSSLRHVRLHQEQDGAVPAEGQVEPAVRFLHRNGKSLY